MTPLWSSDDGLTDVTSAFQGLTQPLSELIDDIHRRGWTVGKIDIKDGEYVAQGKNPHGEKLEATGRTDATAVGNLLVKVMRREHMRSSALRAKLGAWDPYPIEQQASAIAQAYAGAPVYEPKAAPSWMELAQDCGRRAQIIRTQIAVEYTNDPTPYESADDMREDVGQKRHILVTRAYPHHPVWSEQQMLDYRLIVDVLGHMAGGGDWGWHGTCLAFATLAPLLAESPQKALFTELLGQTAFGIFYRQWGPQKVCFLKDLIDKEQEKENKPGHSGVHPSQSIVPVSLPRIGFHERRLARRLADPEFRAGYEAERARLAAAPALDPNANWDSGISPLQDAAYLWQRQDGVDPLDSQAVTDNLRQIEPGLSNMHPELAKQSVINALRSSLLGSRSNSRDHAVHYQDLMHIPSGVDDPMAYQDALEQQRENWNQGKGYAPESHKQHWPEERQFKQWVKASNPQLDDGDVQRLAKRELLHMLTEEEERILAQDQGEQLTSEVIEHEAYEALKRRLKALTKPNVDQKVDFGDDHLFHEATYHADMYPPYLASRMRPMAQISRYADALSQAAREDLLNHRGAGHHFRSQALSLGIPHLGPRQVSNAWLHLAPQTSQLGVIEPQLDEVLGHNYETDMSNRDYFKHERELGAARDASGYNHVPLGAFSSGLWDQKVGGPGYHTDHTPFKAYSPARHDSIDWNTQAPAYPAWSDPYWWQSTQEARDQVAQDFDRTIATEHPRDEIPFAKTAGAGGRSPWVDHPQTGQRVTGAPGTSLMQHLKQTFGHPSAQDVWDQEYEVGKA